METSGHVAWAKTAFGLDVSPGGIRVVRAERAGREVRCRSVEPGLHPGAGSGDARAAVSAVALRTRDCVVRWLQAPLPSLSKARRVFPALLDVDLPFPIEECVCRFLDAGPDGAGRTRTLAVAARVETLRTRLDALRAQSIDPVVVDVEALALWTQSLREQAPAAGAAALRAVVYLGDQHAVLVLGRGDRFLSAHNLGGPPGQEIQRLLRVQFDAAPGPVEWCWCGPGAADAERLAALQQGLGASWPGPQTKHDDPAYFLARALATRALLRGPYRCNLREGELEHPAVARRAGRRRTAAAAACLAAGLALCALNAAWRMAEAARESALDQALGAAARGVSDVPLGPAKGAQALRILEDARRKEIERMVPVSRFFEPTLRRAMERVLAAAEQRSLRVDNASFRPQAIVVSGVAVKWEDCRAFMQDVEDAGLAAQATRREPQLDQSVRFTMSIKPAGGGAP
jgi:hypothetical protein